MIWTECQGACSKDDSLIVASNEFLVLVTQWGAIEPVVNVCKEVAVFKRRRHGLHMARLEGMFQQTLTHREPFKLCVEVAVAVCFKHLVVADLVLVVLANDADFSR